MAETILYNTLTEIVKKLGSMVNQEIELVQTVKNELHNLENTVSTITAVLLDAEEQQATNHEVADWLGKLNDAFYDADDLLDDFSTELLRHQVMSQNGRLKKVRNFFSRNQLAFSSKMAHELMAIRERLDAIAKDRKNYHFIERSIENIKREETQSFIQVQSVMGREGDKMTVIKILLDNNVQEQVSVVAIVGIGGIGKTTLAQLVYNDEEVTKYFEDKIWVCVSNSFDVKPIAQKIIGCGVGKDLQLEEVQNHLRTKVDGKRYLLVLDDVWNENREMWLRLKDLLMGGSRGSKILITTRNQLVANITEANPTHHLKGLSEEKSWTLFEQMAFKQGEKEKYENTSRVSIGKEIVEKCKGVPLAIRAIGSLLYSKDTENEWLLFKDKDLLKIAQKENIILPILKLSYDYLPLNLKRCFACCSLCLKNQEISKQKLIQLWIAHGFIQSEYENEQLEDVGNLYFMELLRRSFFQDVKRDEGGDIESCKMHDFVHDLAQWVARHENSTLNSDAKNVTQRTRHESFGFRIQPSWEIPTHSVKANKSRTFILKNHNQAQDLKEKVFKRIVSTSKLLRVLDLSKLKINTMPGYIRKLKHLRYLDLSYNHMETLPSSVTELVNLQTLKLNECYRLVELPRDTKNLVNLRHLELDKCSSLIGMPCGLGELTSLLTLTTFVADSCSQLSELQGLKNLGGRLRITMRRRRDSCCNWCLKNATAATEGKMEETNHLEAKQYLKKLELEFQWIDDEELLLESLRPHRNLKELEIYDYGGVSFPSWIMDVKIGLSSLRNLVRITMGDCRRCTHLPLFGQLPSLQFLGLWNISSVEYIDNSNGSGSGSGSGGEESLSSSLPSSSSSGAATIRRSDSTFFRSLKELELCYLHNLKGWWRSETAAAEEEEATTTSSATLPDQQSLPCCLPSFPSLSMLTIKDCPNLASIPILQPCLEQLHLEKVSKKLVEQELMMTRVSPTPTDTVAASSSLLPLSNLKYLTLRNITDLDDDEAMQFLQDLGKIFFLSIESISELVSLPLGLQHLTTLQTLQICECDNLMALPEWIGKLTSLERLFILSCPKLTSLPNEMRQLTALQKLTIQSCTSNLYDRCQEGGEDWPKIADIRNIDINYELQW